MLSRIFAPLKILNRDDNLRITFLIVCFALASFQILRSAGHYSPIYGGDEYAYFISGLYRSNLPLIWARDPAIQKIVNPAYLLMIRVAADLFNDAAVAMRLASAILFSVFVGYFGWYVKRMAGFPHAILCVAVLGVLPSSAYSAAVMPDVLYYCAITAAVLSGASLFPRRYLLGALTSGWFMALAFLLKPHAVAPTLATCIFFVAVAMGALIGQQRAVALGAAKALITFIVGWYVSLLLFSLLFMDQLYLDPRYPLGLFYNSLSQGMTTDGLRLALQDPLLLVQYFLANIFCVLMVTFPFLCISALNIVEQFRQPAPYSSIALRHAAVIGWLSLAVPITLAVVSLFTFTVGHSNPGEALRLHARYYAFMYIIAIVAGFAVSDWAGLLSKPVAPGRLGRVNGYVFLSVGWLTCLCAGWLHNRGFKLWFQDNTELFSLFEVFTPNFSFQPSVPGTSLASLILLMIAPFGALLFRRRIVLYVAIVTFAVFTLGLARTTRIQHVHSAVIHFRIETGQLVRSILAQVPDNQILFIGQSRYGETAHVLFGAKCACQVMSTSASAPVQRSSLPPDIKFVFSVDNVPLDFATERMFWTPAGTLYRIL